MHVLKEVCVLAVLVVSSFAQDDGESIKLSTCGQTGYQGPTQAMCSSIYGGADFLVGVNQGVQEIVIPKTATYKISAVGGRGGNSRSYNSANQLTTIKGGSPAKVIAEFTLKKGDRLSVVVGQDGQNGAGSDYTGARAGAGGGGTFVWDSSQNLMMAAGGGGGAATKYSINRGGYYSYNYYAPTYAADASIAADGSATASVAPTSTPSNYQAPAGATDGDGALRKPTRYGHGGSGVGWNGPADCSNHYSSNYCGKQWNGGVYSTWSTYYPVGGFGGGGSTYYYYSAGGGGGYSGGAGGDYVYYRNWRTIGYYYYGGGGGGSYIASSGKNPERLIETQGSVGCGAGAGGSVVIEEVVANKNEDFEMILSSCGAEGADGPATKSACDAVYSGAGSQLLDSVSNGIQVVKIPETGHYRFDAGGAPGGGAGGKGAIVSGTFKFNKDDKIRVLVGQEGSGPVSSTIGGGGGGATFVWKDGASEPLLVGAGGGGGPSVFSSRPGSPTLMDGQLTLAGSFTPTGEMKRVTGGKGGMQGSNGGGAGAGWNGDGDCFSNTENCGKGRSSGFTGGKNSAYYGGFGGGGAPVGRNGGGGGGYNGGGAGVSDTDFYGKHGGGGGSFISGLEPSACKGSAGFFRLTKVPDNQIGEARTLTTCGAAGPTGPSGKDCEAAYKNSMIDTSKYTITGSSTGIQQITFNVDGIYKLTAAGAQGGSAGGKLYQGEAMGGKGAKASGVFNMKKGDKVNVVVGQMPATPGLMEAAEGRGGGGGGGTFVYRNKNKNLMLAAGGGGGGYRVGTGTTTSYVRQGYDAVASEDGASSGAGTYAASGGSGGRGAPYPTSTFSQVQGTSPGGAGFKTKAGCSNNAKLCGGSLNENFLGGFNGDAVTDASLGEGGFGGGSAAADKVGGGAGGGGFSGGAGAFGYQYYYYDGAGAGGGSKANGVMTSTEGGANSGSGYVMIEPYELDTDKLPMEFDSCGHAGRLGPKSAECLQVYEEKLRFKPELSISVDASGKQTVTVPEDGLYLISGSGAKGGSRQGGTYAGGKGAVAGGVFDLKKGDKLTMVIGQSGSSCTSSGCGQANTLTGGGGGGGTFLFLNDNMTHPVLVAGGGGGTSGYGYALGQDGVGSMDGSGCLPWTTSIQGCDELGGKMGMGGKAYKTSTITNLAGAGAGYLEGGDCSGITATGLCGSSIDNNLLGGKAFAAGYLEGGFGGGGGASRAGGGGGGASGGAGGGGGGGGGGSMIDCFLSPSMVSGDSDREHGHISFLKTSVDVEDAVLFETCASTGRSGPTSQACEEDYKKIGVIPTIQNGVQYYRATSSGEYEVTAMGAKGGDSENFVGGRGASVTAKVQLSAGEVLAIVVGQAGSNGLSGSGGGATYIYKDNSNSPIIVAGGGGGASPTTAGQDGRATNAGGESGDESGTAGLGGRGATVSSDNLDEEVGGAGAGWLTSGACGVHRGLCGESRGGGFIGGEGPTAGHSDGGFGGGGAATDSKAGGGGGYSGGAGGDGAGGGGSYKLTGSGEIIEGGNEFLPNGIVIMKRPCPVGQTQNANGACAPLNSCAQNPCGDNSQCKDHEGDSDGYDCICNQGYEANGDVCINVNACETTPCPANSDCEDKEPPFRGNIDGRTCSCRAGYEASGTGANMKCVEINACLTSPCSIHAECIDSPPPAGAGMDGRQCGACPEPFQGDGEYCDCTDPHQMPKDGTCVDIDACVDYPCGLGAQCVDLNDAENAPEGRQCTCVAPLVLANESCICDPTTHDGDHTGCDELTACQKLPCGDGATCTEDASEISGRTCSCPETFQLVGDECKCPVGTKMGEGVCEDIDACELVKCPLFSICEDKLGVTPDVNGRTCTCYPGYELQDFSPTQQVCKDIDACVKNPCPANSQCTDILGGDETDRECQCDTGYEMSEDGTSCDEVNPCEFDITPCGDNSECVKGGPGEFECVCDTGYTQGLTGECVDVNACIDFPCSETESCTDKPAPAANKRSGRICTDVDACIDFPCSSVAKCLDFEDMPNDKTGRNCTCGVGYTGPVDGDTSCVSVEASGTGDDDDSSASTTMIILIVVVVVFLVYIAITIMMYKKTASTPAVVTSTYSGSAFENPAYDMTPATQPEPMDGGNGGYMDVQADTYDDGAV